MTTQKIAIYEELISPDNNIYFKQDSFEGVIFGKEYYYRNDKEIRFFSHFSDTLRLIEDRRKRELMAISGDSLALRFVPSAIEAIKINSQMKSYLFPKDNFVAKNISNYLKQYYGYITRDRDTVVYINCAYDDGAFNLRSYWKQQKIVVFDGGHYYFRIKYSYRRQVFFDYDVNGEA